MNTVRRFRDGKGDLLPPLETRLFATVKAWLGRYKVYTGTVGDEPVASFPMARVSKVYCAMVTTTETLVILDTRTWKIVR